MKNSTPTTDFDDASEAQPAPQRPPEWFALAITIRTPEEIAESGQDHVDVEYIGGASFLNAFRTENLTLCAQLEKLVVAAIETGDSEKALADSVGYAIQSVWNDGAVLYEQAELFLNAFSRQYLDAVYQHEHYLEHFRYLLDLPTGSGICFTINGMGYGINLLDPQTLLDAIADEHTGASRREFTAEGRLNDLPVPSGARLN